LHQTKRTLEAASDSTHLIGTLDREDVIIVHTTDATHVSRADQALKKSRCCTNSSAKNMARKSCDKVNNLHDAVNNIYSTASAIR